MSIACVSFAERRERLQRREGADHGLQRVLDTGSFGAVKGRTPKRQSAS